VPLFPLPNVVVLPGAVLPLHIFEPRYQRMTGEAITGDQLIAMALLRPGWEKNYHDRPAIEPVVCVGQIVAHERLDNGNYNLLLQGKLRASVRKELSSGGETPYRVADIAPLDESAAMEIDLVQDRSRLVQLFDSKPLASTSMGRQFARLLNGPMLTASIADLIAFNYLEDVDLKQTLLSDPDVRHRVAHIVSALACQSEHLPPNAEINLPDDHDPSLN